MEKSSANKSYLQKHPIRFALIGLVIVFVVHAYLIDWLERGRYMTEEQKTAEYFAVNAYVCAQEKVKELLKAPTTAKFPRGHTNEFTQYVGLAEGKYPQFSINSYVDAQNSFGAMIRSNYSCDAYCDTNKKVCICECTIQ